MSASSAGWLATAGALLAACAGPRPPAREPAAAGLQALEQAALERQVENGLPHMRTCYQREQAVDPGIERRMALLLYVMPSGRVEDFSLMDAEIDAAERVHPSQLSDAMAKCLGVEVMTWQFAPTAWHGELQLVHPPLFVVRFAPKPPTERPNAASGAKKQAIREVIARYRAAVASCYDEYLVRAPTANELTIRVQFFIQPSGVVSSASLVEPAPIDDRFASCLLGVVQTMSFAPTAGDPGTAVEYPFRFERAR